MTNNPYLNNKDYKLHNVKLGNVYLFNNYIVTEFNEGVDINFNNFKEVTDIINNHFGDKPFGLIANRLNSYSIDLTDAGKFNANFPNLKAYAIVLYNSLTRGVFEIENHFFEYNRAAFKTLENAADWVEKTLSSQNL